MKEHSCFAAVAADWRTTNFCRVPELHTSLCCCSQPTLCLLALAPQVQRALTLQPSPEKAGEGHPAPLQDVHAARAS